MIDLVKEIFGVDPLNSNLTENQVNINKNGGEAIFIPRPDANKLEQVLAHLHPSADIQINNNSRISPDYGKFSYIHKVKDGRSIYLFANSSDEYIDTEVLLKGKIKPQFWNPHTGEIKKNVHSEEVTVHGELYTRVNLNLEPVKSLLIVSGL